MNNSLPIGDSYSPEQLRARFVVAAGTPFDDPQMSYRIMVPRDWRAAAARLPPSGLSTQQLQPLVTFTAESARPVPPSLQLSAAPLVRGVSAANWLRYFAQSTGKRIDKLVDVSRLFADSLMLFDNDGASFTSRVACRIDRDRIFVILGTSERVDYESNAEIFGVAVASFKLPGADATKTIEAHAPIAALPAARFEIARSWAPVVREKPPQGRTVVDLTSVDGDGNLSGLMRVKSIAKQSSGVRGEVIDNTLAEFAESNVVVKEELSTRDLAISAAGFSGAQLMIYAAVITASGLPQELWVSVFEDSGYWYCVSLLTPARHSSFFAWAVNTFAFEQLLASFSKR